MDDNENTNPISASEEFLHLLDEFLEKYPEYKRLLDKFELGAFSHSSTIILDELLLTIKDLKNYETSFSLLESEHFQQTKDAINSIQQMLNPYFYGLNLYENVNMDLDAKLYWDCYQSCTIAVNTARDLIDSLMVKTNNIYGRFLNAVNKFQFTKKNFTLRYLNPNNLNFDKLLSVMAYTESYSARLRTYASYFSEINEIQLIHDIVHIFDEINNSLNDILKDSNQLDNDIFQQLSFLNINLTQLLNILSNEALKDERMTELKSISTTLEKAEKYSKIAEQAAGIISKMFGKASDKKMGDHFSSLTTCSTFLWFLLILILSSMLFLVSLLFDDINYYVHFFLMKILNNTSFHCLDQANEKIICVEKIINMDLHYNTNIYSYIASRVTIIASILIPLLFSIKNFNVNKHNNIYYLHNAAVFNASITARDNYTGDNEKLFLEKYADFLFKPHDTGMVKSTDSGMPYDKVIDLLTKTLGRGKEKD